MDKEISKLIKPRKIRMILSVCRPIHWERTQTILQSTCTITHCPLLKLTSLFRPSEKFGTHSIILGIVLFFSASLNSWQMICVALIMLESLICLSSDNTIFSHLGAGARFPDFYCVFYVTKLCVSTKAMFQWRVTFCEWRFTHDTIFMVDDSLLLHIFPRFFDKTSAFQPI